MNINDIEKEIPEVPDMLKALFDFQWKLMLRYYEIEEQNRLLQTRDIPVNMDDLHGQARLKDIAWRITEELGEAMNCLKNKPWKQTPMPTDLDHFYEELADFLHFTLELFITAGLDAKKLFALYFLKMNVNEFRQLSGY